PSWLIYSGRSTLRLPAARPVELDKEHPGLACVWSSEHLLPLTDSEVAQYMLGGIYGITYPSCSCNFDCIA
uniref:Uncharacterized protein n=1 Tax=Triticum urartu TaxID=4572 RepID=A0A8R7PCX1_TRIUA